MRGYSTIKQFIFDHKLYRNAKKIDPGREGETITSFFKARIDSRMKNASKSFKSMITKNKYALNDLKFIATHDTMSDIHNLEHYIKECFGTNYASPKHYKILLASNAFRSGRLRRLYQFIPVRIETKNAFIRFMRTKRGITTAELNAIMSVIGNKKWQSWLDELEDDNKLTNHDGRVMI